MRTCAAVIVFLLIAGAVPAMAQSNNILVVETCGTATLQAGQNRIGVITVDTSGNLCTGSGGGGAAQDVNVSEVSGTATSVNTGNADAGTQRVVIATNQPSVATNISVVAGAAAAAGAGATTAGTLRIVQANDSPAVPVAGALTTAGCTVGAASAQCVAASAATRWIQIQNTHATNHVACSWGGTAILNDSGSFMLAAGQSASWGPATGGVPTNALNCIASGAGTPLYVERR